MNIPVDPTFVPENLRDERRRVFTLGHFFNFGITEFHCNFSMAERVLKNMTRISNAQCALHISL